MDSIEFTEYLESRKKYLKTLKESKISEARYYKNLAVQNGIDDHLLRSTIDFKEGEEIGILEIDTNFEIRSLKERENFSPEDLSDEFKQLTNALEKEFENININTSNMTSQESKLNYLFTQMNYNINSRIKALK